MKTKPTNSPLDDDHIPRSKTFLRENRMWIRARIRAALYTVEEYELFQLCLNKSKGDKFWIWALSIVGVGYQQRIAKTKDFARSLGIKHWRLRL